MAELILHRYQVDAAIKAALLRRSLLIAQPGMGKTAIALLTARLIDAKKVLVVAPLQVAINTWPMEIGSWDLFDHFNYTVINRRFKFDPTATVHITNPENLKSDFFNSAKYDFLIIDESTLYKNTSSKRFQRLRKIASRIPDRIALTGNPIPRDYQDVFGQVGVVDGGETFGRYVGAFRKLYFDPIPQHIAGGQQIVRWEIKPGAAKMIQEAMKPICTVLDADGLLELPPLIERNIWVSLDDDEQSMYDRMERELFAEIGDAEVMTFSAGGAYWKCHQMANGAVYDSNGKAVTLHTKKIEALKHLVDELNGKPLLVAYKYEHDFDAIKKEFEKAKKFSASSLDAWNAGRIQMYCAQIQSASRGLNLQRGGNHLAFYSLTDNYDDYYQMVCRLYRQGAKGKVFVHRILTARTVDEAILTRTIRKSVAPAEFISALVAYKNTKLRGLKLHEK